MPSFQLKRLDGTVFDSTAELSGKNVVISFWRLNQPYSEKLLKDLPGLQKKFGVDGVAFVSVVSGKTDPTRVAALVKEMGVKAPVLLDPDRSLYGAFHIIVSPTTWFVDTKGVMRFEYPGHRRDFLTAAEADLDLLLGRISETERADEVKRKKAPPSKGTIGGPVRYKLAKKFLRDGDWPAAKEQMQRAWKSKPRSLQAGVDLGLMLLSEKKNEEALGVLSEAAKLLPEDPRAQGAKGVALIRNGKPEEGEPLLQKGISGGASDPLLFYEMGMLCEGRKEFDKACGYYKQGIERLLQENGPHD